MRTTFVLHVFCDVFRRIAYQESSQTFGVISMRMDLQDSNGLNPTRPSASTHAAMMSSSSSGKVTMGTSTMGEHSAGDEVEVHSLLIIDQHTFEGKAKKKTFLVSQAKKIKILCHILLITLLLHRDFIVKILLQNLHRGVTQSIRKIKLFPF